MNLDLDEVMASYDEIPCLRLDVILPTQWADSYRQSNARNGIGKLCLALLEDAIEIIKKFGSGHNIKSYQVRSDLVWIFSKREGPFSMVSCCDVLDLNSEAIQKEMYAYVDEHKERFDQLRSVA